MSNLAEPGEAFILGNGQRVPNEVHSFSQRVTMMNPVMAEDPDLSCVQRRQHRQPRHHSVESLGVEQSSVRGVVSDGEQSSNGDTGKQPQRYEE